MAGFTCCGAMGHVVVVFTGVELTGNSGNPVTITFPTPKSVDLMTRSNTASAVLFDQPIPTGSYGQIRLMVTADGSANNSYIDFADGSRMGLQVPSGSETGFKLVSGFQPLTSKVPVATSAPPYYYQFTFLPPGTYTVAFTCQAALDNPDQTDSSVILAQVATTAVTAGQTARVDIALGSIQG